MGKPPRKLLKQSRQLMMILKIRGVHEWTWGGEGRWDRREVTRTALTSEIIGEKEIKLLRY